MKKTYIAPALYVQKINIEIPVATSLGMHSSTVSGTEALGKERFEEEFVPERTGWEDGLW